MAICQLCGKKADTSKADVKDFFQDTNGPDTLLCCTDCYYATQKIRNGNEDGVSYFSVLGKSPNASAYAIHINDYYQKVIKVKLDEIKIKLKEQEEQLQKHQEETSNILISSGFSFDGYHITKYSGYISGDDAVHYTLGGDTALTDVLVKIRRQALLELKEAALALGCNAVIGVDFDYLTLEPQEFSIGGVSYKFILICVTANGNAVVIEKE